MSTALRKPTLQNHVLCIMLHILLKKRSREYCVIIIYIYIYMYIYIYIYLTKITDRYFKHVYVSNIKNAPCKYGFRVLSYTTAPPGQHRTPRSHKAISYTTHPQGSILHHIHPVQYRTPHSTSAVSYTAILLIPDMSSFDAI